MRKVIIIFIALVLLFEYVFTENTSKMLNIVSNALAESQYETLKPGSKGQAVLDARMRLYELGYFKKVPTQTEYTKNMMDYVKKFEKDYGLKQDGILSPEDQEVLFGKPAEESQEVSNESKYETLQPGSKGQVVLDARMRLYELGYFSKVPTQTEYTKNMMDYVKKFEKDYGLKQDGILSPEDQEVLFGTKNETIESQQQQVVLKDKVSLKEFKKFYGEKLTEDDDILWAAYSHNVKASGRYSLEITEQGDTIIMTIMMHNSELYNSDLNKFINAYLNAAGYYPNVTDWNNYTTLASKNSASLSIDGFAFSFTKKTKYLYDVNFWKPDRTEFTQHTIKAYKISSPSYTFSSSGTNVTSLSSIGNEVIFPTYNGSTAVNNISFSSSYCNYDENVTSVVIGEHVKSVSWKDINSMFPNLEAYKVSGNNPYLASIDGCLYDKINKTLICCPPQIKTLVIPEGITAIGNYACANNVGLTSVTIPSSCEIIGAYAFEKCSKLKNVTFNAGATLTIGSYAFSGATSLPSIDLSEITCTLIDSYAFNNCSVLSSVSLSQGLKSIGNSAFEKCIKLSEIHFPNSLDSIGGNAFVDTNLSFVELPEGLVQIGAKAFNCPLTQVEIPSTVKEFAISTFPTSCVLSIADGNSTYYEESNVIFTYAGDLFFYPYKAINNASYIVPDNVTTIACPISNVQDITIPASVTEITTSNISGTWHVVSGSYAESYAIKNKMPYESTFVENNDLSWLHVPTKFCLTDFEFAGSFANGLAEVKKDGKYGFIDTTGNLVSPCQWDDTYSFAEGLAMVKKDGKYGFIDTTGTLVSPCKWDEAYYFSEGLAYVKKDGKHGFIDTTGTLVSPCQWDDAWAFSEGLAMVKKGSKYGYIDTTGTLVSPCQWDYAENFSEGLALVKKDGKFGFIDTTGKLVITLRWDSAYSFSEGLTAVKNDGKFGFIDTTGKLIITLRWDSANSFSEGLAYVKKDGKFGFIDTTGTLVSPCQWDYVYSFGEGLAMVKKNGKHGFIDTKGKLVIPCQWDDAYSFSEGLAKVKKDGKFGFIDTTGKLVIPCQWDNAYAFSEGLAWVKKDGKWGFIDTKGNIVFGIQ